MSNFQFLRDEFLGIYKEAIEAEKLALTSPKASAILSRSALEMGVNWLYQNDADLEYPYDTTLNSLIHNRDFKEVIKPSMFREINLIRLNGNNAAHGKSIGQDHSLASIKNLFRFLGFLGKYYSTQNIELPFFSIDHIPDGKEQEKTKEELEELKRQYLQLKREYEQQQQVGSVADQEEIYGIQIPDFEQVDYAKRRKKREQEQSHDKAIPTLVSEAATRSLYIDTLLKDAGWDNLREGKDLEYEVQGMPISTNSTGIGYVDYVLWGKDGKPLAVVEAKKTMADARKGRHQASLYADCLEQMHKQRPIIFYTNGFETYVWDDQFYVDREISGFYTQDELQLLIDRRTTRKDPRHFQVNKEIAGRAYQIEAIQRVAENIAVTGTNGTLRGAGRASLLVMATGSGKTRTAAAIVDMLSKSNWVKRVLFLADRNALVTQAKNAFKEHLPELSSIDLTKEKEDDTTRLVFSTYPTIMNKIDGVKSGEQRFYGVGHFDLIIIDEAHRSVYQKYRAIFEYFDALLIGLTATPKKDIDRNTYSLFGIEDDVPTFAYELDTAVEDGFLVPPKSISVPLKFQREGIKYSELTEAEKEEYEEKFGDPTTEEVPDQISGSAVNKWLFNTDTVDRVLEHVMTDGIKVDGGDKLGKTIIFAKNHAHAVFIRDRFNKNYPEYGGKFLEVIDNYETKAQDLLEKFVDPYQEQNPQIAVSVDMMDTGVDAPRVVNLVFFKIVRSVTKFWQMIGRGTRLCPDLFAPSEDKTHFLIFDYCENFEFFDEQPDGVTPSNPKSLQQQVFEGKLQVAHLISELEEKSEAEQEIRDNYLFDLHKTIANLDRERFVVRKELRYVNQYSDKNKWLNLSKSDLQEIRQHLSHLQTVEKEDDELARRFDVLILSYQIALLLEGRDTTKFTTRIYQIASGLQRKDNIPQIKTQLPLIKELQTESYWKAVDVRKLERVRTALRELIKYLDSQTQNPVYTNFQDYLDLDNAAWRDPAQNYIRLQSYKDRVESYIRRNKHHITIDKLNKNIPITSAELKELERILFTEEGAESKEKFEQEYGEMPLGVFIRGIIGLDAQAANDAFADFLTSGNLTADQMTFIKKIISFLTVNGRIDKKMLFESPFTDQSQDGVSGVFKDEVQIRSIFKILEGIDSNAEIA